MLEHARDQTLRHFSVTSEAHSGQEPYQNVGLAGDVLWDYLQNMHSRLFLFKEETRIIFNLSTWTNSSP